MALSILKDMGMASGKRVLEADIGTNEYYEYKIGKSKRKSRGLELIDEVTHQSSMMRSPIKNKDGFQTQFIIRLPANLFENDSRYIQLFSYKDRRKVAPAIAEVINIKPSLTDLNGDYKLPKIMTIEEPRQAEKMIPVKNTAFNLQENKVSEALLFNTILGVLPDLLSNALPFIGKLLPGLQKATPVVSGIPDTAGQLLPELMKIIPSDVQPGAEGARQVVNNISPDTIKAILETIQSQVAQNGGNGQARAQSLSRYSHDFAINPATLMQLAPLLEKVLSPETIQVIGDNPVKLFKAVSDSALKFQKMELDHLEKINPGVDDPGFDSIVQGMGNGKGYSTAKVAPALLAALPALAPLLEKVLSPDMIKAVGDQPVKLFNAIADAGLKHTQQELQHLENINPGVDDAAFDRIVNSMSTKSALTIKSVYSDSLSIKFLQAHTIQVGNKARVVYDRRSKINLPVQLESNAKNGSDSQINLGNGIFQLIIQDGDDMDVLLEKTFKLKNVVVGSPLSYISLDAQEIQSLPINKDLKVELTFLWKGKEKKTLGTFINHYVTLTDGYIYQRAGDNITSHFALNDVNKYRNYWHKIWEGGPTSHERWKIDFECKYYYHLNTEDESIKKLETRKKLVSDSAKVEGADDYRRKISAKMKSGMAISLEGYNQVLQAVGSTALSEEQLNAFHSHEFLKTASVCARFSADFRGRKGESSALWAYPEGNIQEYILSRVVATDATGLVSEVQDERVSFPKFSSVHFIGTKSQ